MEQQQRTPVGRVCVMSGNRQLIAGRGLAEPARRADIWRMASYALTDFGIGISPIGQGRCEMPVALSFGRIRRQARAPIFCERKFGEGRNGAAGHRTRWRLAVDGFARRRCGASGETKT
jgi:hypothetical protein